MTFEIINKEVFESLLYPIVFENVKTDRCYALLKDRHSVFKLSWDSDLLKPSIITVQPNVYAIGIDEHLALVDFNSNQIALNIELPFSFHEAQVISTSIIIACELEIMIVDVHKYQIMNRQSLPDIYDIMELNGDKIEITCMDGSIVTMQIN